MYEPLTVDVYLVVREAFVGGEFLQKLFDVRLRWNVHGIFRKLEGFVLLRIVRNHFNRTIFDVLQKPAHQNGDGKEDGQVINVHAALLQSAVRVHLYGRPVGVEDGTIRGKTALRNAGPPKLSFTILMPRFNMMNEVGPRVHVGGQRAVAWGVGLEAFGIPEGFAAPVN